ncbi:hypothetical protein CPB86DRAFT_281951 [Serendipita vermifera]|nr:hypothetical protein CPB86DRAFT_281951 [Serendipita vermifera]
MGLKSQNQVIDRKANTAKLLWNMNHKMSVDPRCRHIAGLTIEGTQTRFWHCDRSVVAASEAFDFVKEPEHLIHILLALGGSTEIDLGLDPTIKCIQRNPMTGEKVSSSTEHADGKASIPPAERTYHITVTPGEATEWIFETVRLLSDSSVTSIYSHGTRVWEVVEVGDPLKEKRVLKDSWPEANTKPEGDIVEEIHGRLKNQPEKLDHLPSILNHGTVHFSNIGADDTSDLIRRGLIWVERKRLPLLETFDGCSLYSSGLPVKRKNPPLFDRGEFDNKREYLNHERLTEAKDIPRQHRRLVHAESPGIAFNNLINYDQILTALAGALQACQSIFSAGYVHRNISSSNVMLSANGSKGILIDFEHVKAFKEPSPHDEVEKDIFVGHRSSNCHILLFPSCIHRV